MREPAVIFDAVWKSYPSYLQITGGIKSFIFNLPRAVGELRTRRTALEGVSFEIYKGENFGFIGRNGAGKSTTLGLIAGVLSPDRGNVRVNGRVSPLLELGAGFHPELSGRANILLNGVLMGLTKEDVLAHEQEIIEFSDLGEFIDMPVRTYSSGMYAKLGFAVVAILKPEILLLDEVLAVGDIGFQQKCKNVFENFRKNPDVTMILVSHSLDSVVEVCDRAAWIEGKTVKMVGPAKEVVDAYTSANKPLVQASDAIASLLPSHIRVLERELDCSAGPCAFTPEIIPADPDALLRVTVLPTDNDYSPLTQWLFPPQTVLLEWLDGTFILKPLQKSTPPFQSETLSSTPYNNPGRPFLISLQAEVAGIPQGASVWLPLFPSDEARQKFLQQKAERLQTRAGASLPPYLWQNAGTIRVVARNIMLHDAVGNFAIELVASLERSAIPARVYAFASCAELAGIVSHIGTLQAEIEPNDILFYHYSTEDEFLPLLIKEPFKKKILYYHNVTPSCWFEKMMPDFAKALDRAREQFPLFSHFQAVIANSAFSLNDVLPHTAPGVPTALFPPTMIPDKLTRVRPEPVQLPEAKHQILWVGRIAPHKRPELALRLFGKICEQRNDIAFVMVGGGRRDMPRLADSLEEHVKTLPEYVRDKILWLEGLDDKQLAYIYRKASLLLSTSAHEGYCLPVSEALSFGLPVAVFPQPAVEETMAGRGTVLPEDIDQAASAIISILSKPN